MFLRWKKAVFITYEICFLKDKLLSNITPSSLTVEDGVTVHPSKCRIPVYTGIPEYQCNFVVDLGIFYEL